MNWSLKDENIKNTLWLERCRKELRNHKTLETWAMTNTMLEKVLVGDPVIKRPKRFLDRNKPLLAAMARYVEDDGSPQAHYVLQHQGLYEAENPKHRSLEEVKKLLEKERQRKAAEEVAAAAARRKQREAEEAAAAVHITGSRVPVGGARPGSASTRQTTQNNNAMNGMSLPAAIAAATKMKRAERVKKYAEATAEKRKKAATKQLKEVKSAIQKRPGSATPQYKSGQRPSSSAGGSRPSTSNSSSNSAPRHQNTAAPPPRVPRSVRITTPTTAAATEPTAAAHAPNVLQVQPEEEQLQEEMAAATPPLPPHCNEHLQPEMNATTEHHQHDDGGDNVDDMIVEDDDEESLDGDEYQVEEEEEEAEEVDPMVKRLATDFFEAETTNDAAFAANAAVTGRIRPQSAATLRTKRGEDSPYAAPFSPARQRAPPKPLDPDTRQIRPHSAFPRFLKRDTRDPDHHWKRPITTSDEYGWRPQEVPDKWEDPRFKHPVALSDVTKVCSQMLAASGGNMTTFKAFR